jgi:hypothetical protein
MKDYSKEVAKVVNVIRKNIKDKSLTSANITIKKEKDENYIINGQFVVGNCITFFPADDYTMIDKT